MNKDDGRLMRKSMAKRVVAPSVHRSKRIRRHDSVGRKETATGRELAPPALKLRRGLIPSLSPFLAPGLGQVVAQALRHGRIGQVKAVLANAHRLVSKYPLQAVLIGIGLGYLLSRTKVE